MLHNLRRIEVALFLLLCSCSEDHSDTSRQVDGDSATTVVGDPGKGPITATDTRWVVPLATWGNYDRITTNKVFNVLAQNGIKFDYVGGKGGQRIFVPFENHREAAELLKSSPFAKKLAIHRIDNYS